MTLLGERWQDDQGQILDYWRVEKADSIIILPRYQQALLLPKPQFRPGLNQVTWDFPGGRWPEQTPIGNVIPQILQRELGLEAENIAALIPINHQGWPVNSSFSNQKLYGYLADIHPETEISLHHLGGRYPLTPTGLQDLLTILVCLQCRALLLDWWTTQGSSQAD
ncbi:NUDIX hydrolase [Synechocystis sp. LKSZ1]